jgi:hypothetical protein
MRGVLLLALGAGMLLAIDVIALNGRYRTDLWQEARYFGQQLPNGVEFILRRIDFRR